MRGYSSLTTLWIAACVQVLNGQTTPVPRRISRDFGGELPWLLHLEGSGVLKDAKVRLLDLDGRVIDAWTGTPTRISEGNWQLWRMVQPSALFPKLETGRYLLETNSTWARAGKLISERTEANWRVDSSGDGWLEQAFIDGAEPLGKLTLDQTWTPGTPLNLAFKTTALLQKVRVQVIGGNDERVLQAWTELPLDKAQRAWKLETQGTWPQGALFVWVMVEDSLGRLQVSVVEASSGAKTGGLPRSSSTAPVKAVQAVAAKAAPAAMVASVPGTMWPTTTWLEGYKDPTLGTWDSANRVATVSAGYGDEEKNETRLWPSDGLRPMSLSITGSDQLGKPLYSVSYLLAEKGNLFTDFNGIVKSALSAVGNSAQLPLGAESLLAGSVGVPVVFAPAHVEDDFGKTLAQGYGWAAFQPQVDPANPSNITGVQGLVSAKAWSQSATPPVVGLQGIRQGALFTRWVINNAVQATGFSSEPGHSLAQVDLDGTRYPYAMTLTSQDEGGRVLATKSLGSKLLSNEPALINPVPGDYGGMKYIRLNSNAFKAGQLPGFTHPQAGTVHLTGHGRCGVMLIIDPDGASVAEIKDPEGRTRFKIVNPTSVYTSTWLDLNGAALYPSTTVRGKTPTADQCNLITAYGFDSEGHLRVVLPPLGVRGHYGTGTPDLNTIRLDETHADTVLSIPAASNNDARAIVFAPTKAMAFATYNVYDISGHLVGSYNPDEGLTKFIVDQKGRVHFSQTESQRKRSVWTRTCYDVTYRIRGIGEVPDSAVVLDPAPVTGALSAVFTVTAGQPFISQNLYDAYQNESGAVWDPRAPLDASGVPVETTPAGTGIPLEVRKLLPGPEIWSAFAGGNLTQTFDGRATERYCYDQDGRIVIRWVRFALGTTPETYRDFAIGIYYDFAGRVKRLVYPAGPGGRPLQVLYAYDDLGRLYSVGTPEDSAYFARYAYQPTGELRAIVYGPGEGFAAKRMLQDPQGWLRELTVQGRN